MCLLDNYNSARRFYLLLTSSLSIYNIEAYASRNTCVTARRPGKLPLLAEQLVCGRLAVFGEQVRMSV